MAFIREKDKVAQNEKKNYVGFCIPKVWQILKRFTGAFHQAQTLFLKSGAAALKFPHDWTPIFIWTGILFEHLF